MVLCEPPKISNNSQSTWSQQARTRAMKIKTLTPQSQQANPLMKTTSDLQASQPKSEASLFEQTQNGERETQLKAETHGDLKSSLEKALKTLSTLSGGSILTTARSKLVLEMNLTSKSRKAEREIASLEFKSRIKLKFKRYLIWINSLKRSTEKFRVMQISFRIQGIILLLMLGWEGRRSRGRLRLRWSHQESRGLTLWTMIILLIKRIWEIRGRLKWDHICNLILQNPHLDDQEVLKME